MRDHGTRARYVHGPDENDQPGRPCRCGDCREANAAAQLATSHRRLRQKWGAEPPTLVDAEPVRAHVRRLQAAGIGWKRVAQAAGVGGGVMTRLLYGTKDRPPSRRVRAHTAQRLRAVRAEGLIADGARVDAAGTVRRLQALVAAGWSLSQLGRRLGCAPTDMPRVMHHDHVRVSTARAVRDLYARLWDQQPPADTPARRGAVSRAKAMARSRGWPPPAGWDDDLIDLPDAELATELERRAEEMDDAEVQACHTARYKHHDLSPLVIAGAREYARRRDRAARQAVAS